MDIIYKGHRSIQVRYENGVYTKQTWLAWVIVSQCGEQTLNSDHFQDR